VSAFRTGERNRLTHSLRADARYLRFFVLFVGVMSCFYLIWDFLDDWVFHKLQCVPPQPHPGFQVFIYLSADGRFLGRTVRAA
jgi:hypothetical protein